MNSDFSLFDDILSDKDQDIFNQEVLGLQIRGKKSSYCTSTADQSGIHFLDNLPWRNDELHQSDLPSPVRTRNECFLEAENGNNLLEKEEEKDLKQFKEEIPDLGHPSHTPLFIIQPDVSQNFKKMPKRRKKNTRDFEKISSFDSRARFTKKHDRGKLVTENLQNLAYFPSLKEFKSFKSSLKLLYDRFKVSYHLCDSHNKI